MKRFLKPARGAIAAVLLASGAMTAQAQLQDILQKGDAATRSAERAQEQINQLEDQVTNAEGEYRSLLINRDRERLNLRTARQRAEAEREKLANIQEELGRIDEITAGTLPMLLDLVDALDTAVCADLPFKLQERGDTIVELRRFVLNPDVSEAQRYREIISAYQRELEFGRTIQTFQVSDRDQAVVWDPAMSMVDDSEIEGGIAGTMFLYGRLALVFYADDGEILQYWNREAGGWEDLPSSYRNDVAQAIRIGEEKAQQDIMYGPITKLNVSAPSAPGEAVETCFPLPEEERAAFEAPIELDADAENGDEDGDEDQ